MKIGLLGRFSSDSRLWMFSIFCFGFLIRGLPELLSGPYPVGYDLLTGYAPSLLALPEVYPLTMGWLWSSLSIFILWFFWKISQIDLFLFLKIAGPIFYGLFVCGFYYFLLKGLKWDRKKSFLTSIVFLLQPAVLRLGWDQLRLMLGMVFLFVLLAKTECNLVAGAEKKPLLVAGLSVLLVLSQQLTAVLFFVVTLFQIAKLRFAQQRVSARVLFVLFPSAAVFIVQLYLSYLTNLGYSPHYVPIYLPTGTGLFAFTNYFIGDPRFIGGNYFTILAYVANLSLYVIVPLIPLAVKGYYRDRVLTPILCWLLVTSYSVVVFPWFAISYYWFWLLLLPIPLTVYAAHALKKDGFLPNERLTKQALAGFALLGIVGVAYASSIITVGYPFAYTYMPKGLVESCVRFEDIANVKEAFVWVNSNVPVGSIVVVPERLQGFASMYLRSDIKINIAPPPLTLNQVNELLEDEYTRFYAVYFIDKVDGSNNPIRLLLSFSSIGIYAVQF